MSVFFNRKHELQISHELVFELKCIDQRGQSLRGRENRQEKKKKHAL